MSTTSTNYGKYKHSRNMEKSTKENRQSAERYINQLEQGEKWSNNRIKNELSSLIAEFSYITDVPVKVSQNNHKNSAGPSYHVYAANTTTVRQDPFGMTSLSDDAIEDKRNSHPKTVEWKDDNQTEHASRRRSPKNSKIRSHKSKPVRSGRDKYVKKSRSKSRMDQLKKDKRKKHERSRSRSKGKSPKIISNLNPHKSRSPSNKHSNKSPSDRVLKVPKKSRSKRGLRGKQSKSKPKVKVVKSKSLVRKTHVTSYDQPGKKSSLKRTSMSQTEVEVVEKSFPVRSKHRSRSHSRVRYWPLRCERVDKKKERRRPRRIQCTSQSDGEATERRSCPLRNRKRSRSQSLVRYWPLRCERVDKKKEKRRPRRIQCTSQSDGEATERRSCPLRNRKRSRSQSLVRYWPLRCERVDKKKERRRPRRIQCTSKSDGEVIERWSCPIRGRKRSQSLVKCSPLICGRRKDKRVGADSRKSIPVIKKYEVRGSIPSEIATTVTIYPKLQTKHPEPSLNPEFLTDSTLPCKCFQCMRKYNLFVKLPNAHVTAREIQQRSINRKKILPKDLWQNMHNKCAFDFGECAISANGFHRQEEIMGLYPKTPYPHHYDMRDGYCQRPLEGFSGESETGYSSPQSRRSVFFKFNCYSHHIDSPIRQYFHSILGQTNFY